MPGAPELAQPPADRLAPYFHALRAIEKGAWRPGTAAGATSARALNPALLTRRQNVETLVAAEREPEAWFARRPRQEEQGG